MPNTLNPILDMAKKLKTLAPLETITHSHEIHNRLCGDSIWFYLHIDQNIIKDIFIKADACSLCRASSIAIYNTIKNETLTEAKHHIETTSNTIPALFDDETSNPFSNDHPLSSLNSLTGYQTRKRCVTLPWDGLKELLDQIM